MFIARAAWANTVTYSGKINDLFGSAADDFAIVGTFRPDFDLRTYATTFGDPFGNFGAISYTRAVNAGAFRPIGAGTLATSMGTNTGTFNATGDISDIYNLQIYLWVFDHSTPDQSSTFAWVTGTYASWRVSNGGSTTIDGTTANLYYVGTHGSDGTINLFFGPIPEPASIVTTAAACSILALRRRRVDANS